MYGGQSPIMDKNRFKTPCGHLEKRKLDTTHHDSTDPRHGARISLNDFLGIDDRGSNCLSALRKKVSKSNLDEFGDPCGVGLLSSKYGRVDLELEIQDVQSRLFIPNPSSRRTIFGEELGQSMTPMARGFIKSKRRLSIPSA